MDNIFGERVCVLRKKQGMTQSELAKLVGLSQDAISLMERGKQMTSMPSLIAIAEVFKVSIDFLVGRDQMQESAKQPPASDIQSGSWNASAKRGLPRYFEPSYTENLTEIEKILIKHFRLSNEEKRSEILKLAINSAQ